MLIGPGSQVVEEYARCLLRHRYDAFFTPLAHDPRRALLQVQVFQPKVYPLAGPQTAVQHQYTGRMDACLVRSARFEVEELFNVFRRKDAANPLFSFLLRQLDTTLDVLQFQQPIYEGLQAPDIGVDGDGAGAAFANRSDAVPKLLAQLAFVGGLGDALAEGLPTGAVPHYGGVGDVAVDLPTLNELHEQRAVFAWKVVRGLCPIAVIHIASSILGALVVFDRAFGKAWFCKAERGWFGGSSRGFLPAKSLILRTV